MKNNSLEINPLLQRIKELGQRTQEIRGHL